MTAQVTIYNNDPDNVAITVVAGNPPADQSALVVTLQASVTTLTDTVAARDTTIVALNAKIAAAVAAAQADKTADNANVAGQGVLDALA